MHIEIDIKQLDEEVGSLIEERINLFKKKRSEEELFQELCFCILAANFNAKRAWELQTKLSEDFLTKSELELKKTLKENGYRFPSIRSKYIVSARKHIPKLKTVVKNKDREYLLFFEGVGYKVASHFLRNVGVFDFAILDFHILDIMEKLNICKRPKTLTNKKYLELEKEYMNFSFKLGLEPGVLDLYLWYLETGKIYK